MWNVDIRKVRNRKRREKDRERENQGEGKKEDTKERLREGKVADLLSYQFQDYISGV